MNTDVSAYGLWPLVVLNAAVIIIFAFSFTHPSTGRDWRSFAHGMRNEMRSSERWMEKSHHSPF